MSLRAQDNRLVSMVWTSGPPYLQMSVACEGSLLIRPGHYHKGMNLANEWEDQPGIDDDLYTCMGETTTNFFLQFDHLSHTPLYFHQNHTPTNHLQTVIL